MDFGWILLALVVLACPAMMFFMMRGSHGSSHGNAGAPPEDEKEREIRALKARLEQLESRAAGQER